MAVWMIPCNIKYYDVEAAFRDLPYVEWHQSRKMEVGDTVYIYVGLPIQAVLFKCLIIKANLSPKETEVDDSAYAKDGAEFEGYDLYMALKCVEKYSREQFTLSKLKEAGLKGSVQGPRTIEGELLELLSFDHLSISGQTVHAIFFHKPDEPYGFLSNWYPSPFELDGFRFSSAEQYIMYRKCMLFGDSATAQAIMATDDPATQQALARAAKGYISAVWAGARQMIAHQALMAKFGQNNALKQQLLATGDAWLVECAGSDKIWACGVRLYDSKRFDAANWDGTNILGFALMEVREQLKKS